VRRLPFLVLALLVLTPAGTAEARKESTCARKDSDTILATKTVRVFRAAGDGDVFGCAYGRRPVLLSQFESETTAADAFAVAGDRVAYAIVTCDRYSSGTDGCQVEMYRADLRARRVRIAASYDRAGGITSLVLSRSGSIAFLLAAQRSPVVTTPARVGVVRGTTPEIAGVGDLIDPRSFALGGRTLFWTKAGRPRTLELP
jgi:hypothetical protein